MLHVNKTVAHGHRGRRAELTRAACRSGPDGESTNAIGQVWRAHLTPVSFPSTEVTTWLEVPSWFYIPIAASDKSKDPSFFHFFQPRHTVCISTELGSVSQYNTAFYLDNLRGTPSRWECHRNMTARQLKTSTRSIDLSSLQRHRSSFKVQVLSSNMLARLKRFDRAVVICFNVSVQSLHCRRNSSGTFERSHDQSLTPPSLNWRQAEWDNTLSISCSITGYITNWSEAGTMMAAIITQAITPRTPKTWERQVEKPNMIMIG
ncbi:hypothetical protein L210DRAFT_3507659 [Boletus edulis BED1]|uniref:Uncharacterized protein n=1 Tax=Boletus edulis BED1 TaxID=1328754 RepID=A0AAD4BJ06_BOLED|nr:hypothetical protein L210DRAFT_3507659 [Boletus edulis BED1]